MKKIGIFGGSGRMGQSIMSAANNFEDIEVGAVFCIDDFKCSFFTTDNFDEFFNNCDVVIDFSSKNGTDTLLKYAISHPKPLCIGTTGLDNIQIELMQQCSVNMPIFYATNMSLGVALLCKVTSIASKILRDFDIEICEMHHKFKKDAPSGTALTLAKFASSARGLDLDSCIVTDRSGIKPRKKDDISVLSLRGGDIVGKHTVGFYADGEYIELNHTATSRLTFANGAIKISKWLCEQNNNLYNIEDFLGI